MAQPVGESKFVDSLYSAQIWEIFIEMENCGGEDTNWRFLTHWRWEAVK